MCAMRPLSPPPSLSPPASVRAGRRSVRSDAKTGGADRQQGMETLAAGQPGGTEEAAGSWKDTQSV